MKTLKIYWYLIAVLIVCGIIASCDTRFENYESRNVAPQVTYQEKTEESKKILDSVKLSKSSLSTTKSYQFKIVDTNLRYVEITTSLAVTINDVKSKLQPLKNDKLNIVFSDIAIGENKATVYCYDVLKKRCEIDITIVGFENLIPVAVLSGAFSEKELILTAKESFDKDRLYGGKIVGCIWIVDGKNKTMSAVDENFTKAFADVKEHTIQLIVFDNDNTMSEAVSKVYSLK